ncbi:MAG: RNA polymerase sigma factor, partial [Ruminiclostridium sp.]
MTLNERLEKARKGSRRDYDVLCAEAADSLYAIAYLTLKDEKDAEAAVKQAESDGFSGIARINDLPHLKAWLIRELTKISVARLKEYRAAGIAFAAASGVKASVDKLPDIERLVYSISAVCGYTVKELSVITGLQEETAEKKLASAIKRLGAGEEAVKAAAAAITAPDSLKAAARSALSDMTAEINRSDDEGMIDEMERISRLAAGAENGEQEEKETERENSPKPETKEAKAEETDENSAEKESDESKEKAEELPAEEKSGEPKLDAETFISVISAEKIKGGEFLQLLGNTRISNAAYREIEHNPNLTKQRLIQLLEESPLTEADYYKLLSAVKQRRELLEARDESRLRQEQAGLFTGRRERPKRKPKEEPKSELAAAIEMETAREEKANQEITAEKESLSGTKPFEYVIPDYAAEKPEKQKEEAPDFPEEDKSAAETEEKPLAFTMEEKAPAAEEEEKGKPLTITEEAGKSAFSQRKNGAVSMLLDKPAEKQTAPKTETQDTETEDEAGIDPFAAIGLSGLETDISDIEDEIQMRRASGYSSDRNA